MEINEALTKASDNFPNEFAFAIAEIDAHKRVHDRFFNKEFWISMYESLEEDGRPYQSTEKYKFGSCLFLLHDVRYDGLRKYEAFIGSNLGEKTVLLEFYAEPKNGEVAAELWRSFIEKNNMMKIPNIIEELEENSEELDEILADLSNFD